MIAGVALLVLAMIAQKVDRDSIWPACFFFCGSCSITLSVMLHCIQGVRECLGYGVHVRVVPYNHTNGV